MSVSEELWAQIADAVMGTTDSPTSVAEKFDVPEDDVEHELAAFCTVICPVCGWWCYSEDPDGVCEECAALGIEGAT